VKSDIPTPTAHFSVRSMWVADAAAFVVDTPVDSPQLQVLSVNPRICSVVTTGTSHTVIGLAGGYCQIQVLIPSDETHNLASAIFTLKVFAPSIKISKLAKSKSQVKFTISAGIRYVNRVVTLWSKAVGAKKVVRIVTPKPIKLNAKGVASVVLPKPKKTTYYLKYKSKVIGMTIVK